MKRQGKASNWAFIGALLLLPLLLQTFGDHWVRIADTCLLYMMLALGMNIVVGNAGLLDLGYVAFYAVCGGRMGCGLRRTMGAAVFARVKIPSVEDSLEYVHEHRDPQGLSMISFHGETIAELRREFEAAVEGFARDCIAEKTAGNSAVVNRKDALSPAAG